MMGGGVLAEIGHESGGTEAAGGFVFGFKDNSFTNSLVCSLGLRFLSYDSIIYAYACGRAL